MERRNWAQIIGYTIVASLVGAVLQEMWTRVLFGPLARPEDDTSPDAVINWIIWAQDYIIVGLVISVLCAFIWLWRAAKRSAAKWKLIHHFRTEWWTMFAVVLTGNTLVGIAAVLSRPRAGSHYLIFGALLTDCLIVFLSLTYFGAPSPYKYIPWPRGSKLDKQLIG